MLLSSHTHTQLHISFPEIAYAYLRVHGVHVTTKLHTRTHVSQTHRANASGYLRPFPVLDRRAKRLREFTRVSPRDITRNRFIRPFHRQYRLSSRLACGAFFRENTVGALLPVTIKSLSFACSYNYLVHSNDIDIIIITHDNTYIFTHTYSQIAAVLVHISYRIRNFGGLRKAPLFQRHFSLRHPIFLFFLFFITRMHLFAYSAGSW